MINSDDVRNAAVCVELSNQEVIEIAYIVMDMLGPLVEQKAILLFDEANCYVSCFYLVRKMLGKVDEGYRREHGHIKEFFGEGRELDNSFDRLQWVTP